MVLRTGHAFSREDLKTEVRSLLGYGRTGKLLDAAIESAIQDLLTKGLAGEVSAGIRLHVK